MGEKDNTSAVEDQKDVTHEEPEVEIIDEGENAGDTNQETQTENKDDDIVQSLQQQIEKLTLEKESISNKTLRIQAEYDNFKKRTQKEKQSDRKYKAQEIVDELLPVIDNFERALAVEVTEEAASFVEGMTMVYNQIKKALKNQGVEEIETVGKEFDPNIHHAVIQVEDDEQESNTVLEEMQKGYMLKDRVIRPAMVKVNK